MGSGFGKRTRRHAPDRLAGLCPSLAGINHAPVGASGGAQVADSVVAVVNNDVITAA